MTYDFSNYICGVNGLTCIGCSLFCRSRKEKAMNREHVVQVGFSFDEDKIINSMTKSLEKKLTDEVEDGVRKNFFKQNDYWGNDIPSQASQVMKAWLNEHKDEVIQETASMLVEKLYRTKAIKDMIKAVGEEAKEYGSV